MIKKFLIWISAFVYNEVKEGIDNLDVFKPLIVETIEKYANPQKVADEITKIYKREMLSLLNKVFKKR